MRLAPIILVLFLLAALSFSCGNHNGKRVDSEPRPATETPSSKDLEHNSDQSDSINVRPKTQRPKRAVERKNALDSLRPISA